MIKATMVKATVVKATVVKATVVKAAALAMVGLLAGGAQAQAQDVAAGQKVFNQCRACHQVGEAAKNGLGPVLNGLFGRQSGSVAGYAYSEANKASGITWDSAAFTDYIRNPKAKIPGTKMAYAGLRDEKQIADLVAFLGQYGPDGKAPP